jgi:hypothetical protein
VDVCKQPRFSSGSVVTGPREAKLSPAVGDTPGISSIPRTGGRMLKLCLLNDGVDIDKTQMLPRRILSSSKL